MTASRHQRVLSTTATTLTLSLLLGGCSYVPVLGNPAPQTPGTKQLTQTELEHQLADYTTQAITATGLPNDWYWGADASDGTLPWSPETTTGQAGDPCASVGPKDSLQLTADISHDPIGDPVPLVKRMTEHWEQQGFTVSDVAPPPTTVPKNWLYEIRADRADGIAYGFYASTEILSIRVATQCSTHHSLTDNITEDWDE